MSTAHSALIVLLFIGSNMNVRTREDALRGLMWAVGLLALIWGHVTLAQTTGESPYWKNQTSFPDDPFASYGQEGDPRWIKFTILVDPCTPEVYFQNSKKYMFHYNFAVNHLTAFVDMTAQQFNAATLFKENQQAILGTVIFPPTTGSPPQPQFNEYGIQFVRQDPYEREQIRDLFNRVKACVSAPSDVQALYFPTYEQQAAAQTDREWFEAQGIALGSTARWAEGNSSYSQGWALGELKFFPADQIDTAYHVGLLGPSDILLTDGVPAEMPFLAGIVSLAPSTPNSHVAILSRTYAVPFVYLALPHDAELAQQLVGHRILCSVYDDAYGSCDTRLIDTEGLLDDATVAQLLDLKKPSPLTIAPMAPYGKIGVSTTELSPADVQYVGGKAAGSSILPQAIPDNCPRAVALSFDLWNAFLDQPLHSIPALALQPGQHMLFWADDDEDQGPTHTSFALSKDGEAVALFDCDGATPIDIVAFGPQTSDISYGRQTDGGDSWESFTAPTPGQPNSAAPAGAGGLVINEIMAANGATIEDPCEPGEYPDWIELYNGSNEVVTLNGMYLTDDVNKPTKWRIPLPVAAGTLREEIERRLSTYDSYPPADMQSLSADLASVRSLFRNDSVTPLDPALRRAVLDVLTDPQFGFDPDANLRFRSSTNVEDSEDFVGAGLYDSFSGCLADDLDDDTAGPCGCDPNRETEDGVFDAIRKTFASFYNDNAYLERLRHDVNETQVGMALLVHHSFPDEIELANGVATLEYKGDGQSTIVNLVTQYGATSVTNPEGTAIPEEAQIEVLASGYVRLTPAVFKKPSSLVAVGRNVLEWPQDYRDLVNLLVEVSDRFREITHKSTYTLDIEYKKMAPGGRVMPAGGLVVKQVRQVPTLHHDQTPFVVNVPTEFEVFTGEISTFDVTDVFADHRLKSRWMLETRSMILDAENLTLGLYTNIRIEYLDDDRVRTLEGQMSLLPGAGYEFDGGNIVDSWDMRDLDNPRAYRLHTTNIPTSVPPAQRPVFTLADFGETAFNVPIKCLEVNVEYDRPVTAWHQQSPFGGPPSELHTTTQNRVYLWQRTGPRDDDLFQERSFSAGGISIETSFYYPAPPDSGGWAQGGAGATAPLKRWDHTTIHGLTTEPIVLKGYYSQTYRPEHHNLIENFLFEPRLEPGISQKTLDELQSQNIRFIHLILDRDGTGADTSTILTHGFE